MIALLFAFAVQAQAAPPPAAQAKPAEPAKPWTTFCCFEKGRTEKDGLVTVVYELSHVPSPTSPQGLEEFQKMIQPYITPGKGRIELSNRLNALSITDTKENIAYVEKMLQLIHKADAPILIEAKVVELRWDKDLQVGIEGDLSGSAAFWTQNPSSESFMREARIRFQPQDVLTTTPFQGSTFRFNTSHHRRGTFGGLIEMFVERGKAQILSQPRVLVRSDQTATIFTGDEVPYPVSVATQPVGGAITTYQYKQAGVKLEVSPRLAAPGQVALRMRPEVTTTFGFVQVIPNVNAPQFTVRSVSTDLLVRDGEEVVIGGLYRRDKIQIRRGLPFLSDIPLIGYLFGKTEDQEVVQEVLFFIKPTIIKSEQEQPRGVVVPDK